MTQGIREFLNTTAGKLVTAVLIVAGLGAIVWSAKANFGESEIAARSRNRMYICSDTLKAFPHELQMGEKYPIESPFSGKATGYPAEPCYWTKEGKPKDSPTWVLLNNLIGKSGPTFCQDCGRLVVGHNPPAHEGDKAPPTQAEYKQSKAETAER